MTPRLARLFAAISLSAITALAAPAATAENFPSKPITIVVPFAAGSGTDQSARLYAQELSDQLNVPVLVENKGGASGFIAAQHVAKAAPDGYTVFLTTNTTQVANPHLFKKLPYDPIADFSPVTLLSTGQMVLLVRPDAPYQNLEDLLTAARQAPDTLSFGSGSSSSQVASELLKQMTETQMLHVPYKSNPQAIVDVIGGQIDFMFADAFTGLQQVLSGKLRALATSGSQRIAAAPEVPTVSEAGVPGYDMTYWLAVYLPARTPADIVQRMNAAFIQAAQAPGPKANAEKTSSQSVLSTPQELADFQISESEKWRNVIQSAGILPQ